MPYIKSEDYERASKEPAVPGELNYAITMKAIAYIRGDIASSDGFAIDATVLCEEYLQRVGLTYTNGNAVMGVLSCALRELTRRFMENPEVDPLIDRIGNEIRQIEDHVYNDLIAPYEDTKIEENGDVFPFELL